MAFSLGAGLSGLSGIGGGYQQGEATELGLDDKRRDAMAKVAMGNALQMLSGGMGGPPPGQGPQPMPPGAPSQPMGPPQGPQQPPPLQQAGPMQGTPQGPPQAPMPMPIGGGNMPMPQAPPQGGMPPLGGPQMSGMGPRPPTPPGPSQGGMGGPPQGMAQLGGMSPPQQQGGQLGQPGALNWQSIVQAIQKTNPGIAPDVTMQAVNQFLPMMTQQSKMDWQMQTLQYREQMLEQRERLLAISEAGKDRRSGVNDPPHEDGTPSSMTPGQYRATRAQQTSPEGRAATIAATADPASQAAALKKFTSGPEAAAIRSFNTVDRHLDTLSEMTKALGNSDVKGFNKLKNAFQEQFGDTAPSDFNGVKQVIANEIIKAIVARGGGVADRKEASDSIDRSKTPEQLQSLIGRYKQLIKGQMDSYRQQYEESTGKKDFDRFLSPGVKGGGATPDSGWKELPGGVRIREVPGPQTMSDEDPDPVKGGQQYAMAVNNERKQVGVKPRSGSAGGAANHESAIPELEGVLGKYARGGASSQDVQKFFKDRGWTVKLRGLGGEAEAFDPSGAQHYLGF